MYILYDCVQTLAENIGPVLARPELVNALMPALIERWNKLPDQAREMFPLLECLSYVAMALGDEGNGLLDRPITAALRTVNDVALGTDASGSSGVLVRRCCCYQLQSRSEHCAGWP